MRITLESDYALRILSALATHSEIVDAKTLADETSVTINFTLKILRKLVACNLVKSYKGVKGGYSLSIPPQNITLKQVIEQIEYDNEVKDYAKTYSNMKAKEAAAIFDTMGDDLQLVADILLNMSANSRAAILGKMDPEIAAKVTAIMNPN